MKTIASILFLFSLSAFSYVPTVESLFRHGANPDIIGNAIQITMKVKKISATPKSEDEVGLVKEGRTEDFYKIFFSKIGDSTRLAQTRYANNSFSEGSLEQKNYLASYGAFAIKTTPEQIQRGLFFAVLNSIAWNNGSLLVNYLKAAGVPVRLNNELINREKIEYLASYKQYLATVNRDRNARKTEANPLRPEDSVSREKVDRVMNESMYVDTKQVKLAKDDGTMAWQVSAGNFESVVSYRDRNINRIKFKGASGEFEMHLKNYWLANGTHMMPRFIIVKDLNGETFEVEVTNLRHGTEKDDDVSKRLRKWDDILQGKNFTESRPAFLL